MKNYIVGFSILFCAGLLFSNCAKQVEQKTTQPALYITLKDDLGKAVAGATVRLYIHTLDSSITKISDSAGIVMFDSLKVAKYRWLAEKGCKTNLVSQTTINQNMIPNVVLYGYSVMTETGALKIINNSTDPYKITDSTSALTFTIKKDTPVLAFRRVRSYLIHSEKLGTPATGKDTLIRIRCGDTSILRLPY